MNSELPYPQVVKLRTCRPRSTSLAFRSVQTPLRACSERSQRIRVSKLRASRARELDALPPTRKRPRPSPSPHKLNTHSHFVLAVSVNSVLPSSAQSSWRSDHFDGDLALCLLHDVHRIKVGSIERTRRPQFTDGCGAGITRSCGPGRARPVVCGVEARGLGVGAVEGLAPHHRAVDGGQAGCDFLHAGPIGGRLSSAFESQMSCSQNGHDEVVVLASGLFVSQGRIQNGPILERIPVLFEQAPAHVHEVAIVRASLAIQRRLVGDELEQDHAEAAGVTLGGHLKGAVDVRVHVAGSAVHGVSGDMGGLHGHQLGDSEVGDFGVEFVIQKDVGAFDVSVEDGGLAAVCR
ncbi:hypothetical protein Mapa_001779 [Marchantia paleacea]|nr:hypothetical protein Mapa_001779 [Marchantia paleacea]